MCTTSGSICSTGKTACVWLLQDMLVIALLCRQGSGLPRGKGLDSQPISHKPQFPHQVVSSFETMSCYVAQACSELWILLCLSAQCWDYRPVPLCSENFFVGENHILLYFLQMCCPASGKPSPWSSLCPLPASWFLAGIGTPSSSFYCSLSEWPISVKL